MTVVETPTFLTAAARCLSDEEREELIGFLARNPERGIVIKKTGVAPRTSRAGASGSSDGQLGNSMRRAIGQLISGYRSKEVD